MLVHALRQPVPFGIVEQLANAPLQIGSACLSPRLDSFANRGADDADQQKKEDDADENFEHLRSEHVEPLSERD